MRYLLSALTISLMLQGCAVPVKKTVTMTHQFSESEHSAYAEKGSASITGQAFLRQQGGGVVTCAGSDVLLVPDTPYFQEAMEHYRAGESVVTPTLSQKFARHTLCDANGNLPSLNYRLQNG